MLRARARTVNGGKGSCGLTLTARRSPSRHGLATARMGQPVHEEPGGLLRGAVQPFFFVGRAPQSGSPEGGFSGAVNEVFGDVFGRKREQQSAIEGAGSGNPAVMAVKPAAGGDEQTGDGPAEPIEAGRLHPLEQLERGFEPVSQLVPLRAVGAEDRYVVNLGEATQGDSGAASRQAVKHPHESQRNAATRNNCHEPPAR